MYWEARLVAWFMVLGSPESCLQARRSFGATSARTADAAAVGDGLYQLVLQFEAVAETGDTGRFGAVPAVSSRGNGDIDRQIPHLLCPGARIRTAQLVLGKPRAMHAGVYPVSCCGDRLQHLASGPQLITAPHGAACCRCRNPFAKGPQRLHHTDTWSAAMGFRGWMRNGSNQLLIERLR